MTREYDARSRVPSKEYKENFDRIFGKAKKERKERSAKRQEPEELRQAAEGLAGAKL